MAALRERIEDMEEVSKELLKLMTGGKAMDMLKHNLAQQEQMIDKLLDTQKTTKQLIRELMITEEKVAQRLSDREEELKVSIQKLQKTEEELLQANEKDENLRINTNELRKQLETLREESRQQQQNAAEEADRSTSATYLVHLYYQICHIDWDYSCEPTLIKGTHYGPDIAQSINLDSSQHSPCFISDYLWNLVNTSW
ncbi:kinetochore protein Spc24 [Python bivittatus]|uniref:Kinetochore protein Spc24 n=1 Tax=Python bivittatus TaxID=176946 RepID=A0A9F5ITT6_PYTBI|nr:kinetochore protein Spc24 [Python bivittatus]XP_025021408.1 kinetochore protein Spc24 [Python bivittatus]XP_025021410.1 kinetochore protein Spc24 [Python bivittatus]